MENIFKVENYNSIALIGALLIILFLFIMIVYLKSKNDLKNFIKEKSSEDYKDLQALVFDLQKQFNKDQYNFQSEFKENFFDSFYKLNENLNEKLSTGVEKGQVTFRKISERLAKIDEAQKNIDHLSKNVGSLQDILTDKKSRGIFGEIQLNQILYNIFGSSNLNYLIQHKLPNGYIVDSMIHLPPPMGSICIDSKFPLENYKKIKEDKSTENERLFQKDIKKHIDDIKKKYILEGVTADQAMMFIPAEAVFSEIHAYHPSLVEYAYEKSVWMVSPTTLMAILSTVQIVLRNIKQQESADLIQQELKLLSKDFKLHQQRWEKLSRAIDTISKSAGEISISSKKIEKRFHKISEVNIPVKKEGEIQL